MEELWKHLMVDLTGGEANVNTLPNQVNFILPVGHRPAQVGPSIQLSFPVDVVVIRWGSRLQSRSHQQRAQDPDFYSRKDAPPLSYRPPKVKLSSRFIAHICSNML